MLGNDHLQQHLAESPVMGEQVKGRMSEAFLIPQVIPPNAKAPQIRFVAVQCFLSVRVSINALDLVLLMRRCTQGEKGKSKSNAWVQSQSCLTA